MDDNMRDTVLSERGDAVRLQVVWFKRDMRIEDNECLTNAAKRGHILPILVVEPEYWALPECSWRHYEMLRQAIVSLQTQISEHGGKLHIWNGSALKALEVIKTNFGEFDLWAHQETGNYWTFKRDIEVRKWCRANCHSFTEPMQFGVWRGSSLNRDRWAKDWDRLMSAPILPSIENASWQVCDSPGFSDVYPDAEAMGLHKDGIVGIQPSGRAAALSTLHSFLYARGQNYRTDMSSPSLGVIGCSRLSVHLVAGSISVRECYQATVKRQKELRGMDTADAKAWRASLSSFIGRLHWHCHFMQKLESEPEMEFRPVARAYEGMRPPATQETLNAFATGRTGYPFVDACMRSLIATGWINFRMRAMLMSFACYDLFIPWQEAGIILARLFTDYEPGIHWTQSQMQSGETGINTLRIYSPVKQGKDHDPKGQFIERWVPELSNLDGAAVHEPWKHDAAADYPPPIVDHTEATKAARDAIWTIRRTPKAKAEAADVLLRHGSRRRPPKRRRARAKASAS